MSFFKLKEKSSKHWTDLYYNALKNFRSGKIRRAYRLSYDCLGMDYLSGEFDKNEIINKTHENPEITLKIFFLSQACRNLLSIEKINKLQEKEKPKTETLKNFIHSAESANELIKENPDLDHILLLDIDDTLSETYLNDRPEKPEKIFPYFVGFFFDRFN